MCRLLSFSVKFLIYTLLLNCIALCVLNAHNVHDIDNNIYPQILVSTPVIKVDGQVVNGEADAGSHSKILLSAGPGELVILNLNYVLGHPSSKSDVRLGHLTTEQAKNINIGTFTNAPRGTLWVVSCYAENDGVRGDTVVAIFTHL